MPHNNLHNMDSQNLPCPRCSQICHSSGELISHLRSRHRLTEDEIQTLRGRGYFEDKVPTAEGDKAILHRDAMLRAQAGNAINIPFVPPPDRKHIASAPAGWAKTIEGFSYEKLISQTHTIDSIIKKILKGSIIANHATLEICTYKKNVSALSELQDKERMLEAKLAGYITSDPEYPQIAIKLYETKTKIKEIKQDVGLDTEKDILVEEWFSGDLNTNEHIEWEEGFMQKALLEAEQVREPKQEIKL